MRQAPDRPPYVHANEAWDGCAYAMLLVDAAAATIVGANPAGWRALGIDGRKVELPAVLDGAMPAVQRLREMAARENLPQQAETLVFWTPLGSISRPCQVSAAHEGSGLLVVRVLGAKPGSLSAAEGASADALGDIGLRARLAHELKTPLGALLAYAEILKDEHFGPLGSERYRQYARNVHEAARHALGVVDSMLKGDAETEATLQLTFADVDPAGIVESCLVVARPLAESAGQVLSAEVPAHLPRIVADAGSVRQMLLNLLTNAIKFAERGDRVKVAVACDGDGPLRISVVDTGPGMEDGRCAGKASEAANAGLGLGLPLTRTLAQANGAALAIDSAVGRGTCATITFGKDRLVPV